MIFVLTIGSLCWQPHMSGGKLFGPLLRAGLVDLDHFFATCKFCICWQAVKKIWCVSRCICPLNRPFFRGGAVFQNWGASASSQFSKIEGLAPQFWKKPSLSTAAEPKVLSQPSPLILARAPHFWISDGTQKNGQLWENFFCTPLKKFLLGNGYIQCDFCKIKLKKKIHKTWPR